MSEWGQRCQDKHDYEQCRTKQTKRIPYSIESLTLIFHVFTSKPFTVKCRLMF